MNKGQKGIDLESMLWTSPLNSENEPQLARALGGVSDPCWSCGASTKWMLMLQSNKAPKQEIAICNKCEGIILRLWIHSYLMLEKKKKLLPKRKVR